MTNSDSSHATPSAWVTRFASLINAGGDVLDYACGNGRHARWLAEQGFQVEAVDRDVALLESLDGLRGVRTRQADLESGPWPYVGRRFDGIVITNYHFRPRLPMLPDLLHDGGVLIYETFMVGNERLGRPRNPAFLLREHELLELMACGMWVVAFEQGEVAYPKPAVVQRICARKGGAGVRLPLPCG